MNLVDFSVNPSARYTLWSGLLGGFFLAMAYFGTDQSQVQRYLAARSITASRLGLLFNGLLKIPMQFLILFVGVMVFVFYQFNPPPVFFNQSELSRAYDTPMAGQLHQLEQAHVAAFEHKRTEIWRLDQALDRHDGAAIASAEQNVRVAEATSADIRQQTKQVIARALPSAKTRDADYVFLSFVMRTLPRGVVGLLLAVVFAPPCRPWPATPGTALPVRTKKFVGDARANRWLSARVVGIALSARGSGGASPRTALAQHRVQPDRRHPHREHAPA